MERGNEALQKIEELKHMEAEPHIKTHRSYMQNSKETLWIWQEKEKKPLFLN
jgi:hypothetical protein